MTLNHFRLPITLAAPLAVAAMLNACVSSEEDPPASASSTTSSTASTTSTTASTTGTTTTATSTTATSTTGTSTTGGSALDCTTSQVILADSVIDFESYDGTAMADGWEFNFNGDATGAGAVYGGLWPLDDLTGDYQLSFVAGADGSTWALSAANASAEDWGGGVGMWTGCMDASSFTGIQFMVNATTPAGTGGLTLGLSPSGSVSAKFTITTPGEWELIQLPFSAFMSDPVGTTTDGSGIGNFVFAAHMVYVLDAASNMWLPEPGAYSLVIDNISFY